MEGPSQARDRRAARRRGRPWPRPPTPRRSAPSRATRRAPRPPPAATRGGSARSRRSGSRGRLPVDPSRARRTRRRSRPPPEAGLAHRRGRRAVNLLRPVDRQRRRARGRRRVAARETVSASPRRPARGRVRRTRRSCPPASSDGRMTRMPSRVSSSHYIEGIVGVPALARERCGAATLPRRPRSARSSAAKILRCRSSKHPIKHAFFRSSGSRSTPSSRRDPRSSAPAR